MPRISRCLSARAGWNGLVPPRVLHAVTSAVVCLVLLGASGSQVAASPTSTPDPPPQVTVEFPNGGELLLEDGQVKLTWTATGGTGALPADLLISIDYGVTYTPIATGLPNTGTYIWTVDPAFATNRTCQDPVYSALLKVVAYAADGTPGEDVSDAPFSIFHITECADPPCCVHSPNITVIAPNGPADDLLVGSVAHLRWAASGSQPAQVAGIDLYMSKDLGAHFQLIATGLDNTSDYAWPVDPAFATNSGSATVDSALFMAVVHDQIGRSSSDVSDAPFSIFDGTVPTLLSVFRASMTPGGVELRWQFGDPSPVSAMAVERAPRAEGPWRTLSLDIRRDGDASVALDREVSVGQSYFYRIRVTWVNGQAGVCGPVSASADPALGTAELGRIGPTPTGGQPVRIEYSVPIGGVVRLSVVDLQGRLVARLGGGAQPAGRYEAVWDPRPGVRSGVYFVRYDAAGRSTSRRIVVAN